MYCVYGPQTVRRSASVCEVFYCLRLSFSLLKRLHGPFRLRFRPGCLHQEELIGASNSEVICDGNAIVDIIIANDLKQK